MSTIPRHMTMEQRLARIESHLGLPPAADLSAGYFDPDLGAFCYPATYVECTGSDSVIVGGVLPSKQLRLNDFPPPPETPV